MRKMKRWLVVQNSLAISSGCAIWQNCQSVWGLWSVAIPEPFTRLWMIVLQNPFSDRFNSDSVANWKNCACHFALWLGTVHPRRHLPSFADCRSVKNSFPSNSILSNSEPSIRLLPRDLASGRQLNMTNALIGFSMLSFLAAVIYKNLVSSGPHTTQHRLTILPCKSDSTGKDCHCRFIPGDVVTISSRPMMLSATCCT